MKTTGCATSCTVPAWTPRPKRAGPTTTASASPARAASARPCRSCAAPSNWTRPGPPTIRTWPKSLRATGDHAAAAQALEEGLRHHPQQRVLQKQHAQTTNAQTVLSSDRVDFGTLRQGQSRSVVLWVRNAGGGALQGHVAAAPGWVRVEPPAFTTRQRQRLVLTADAAQTGPAPAEFRETVVLETSGGRQEIAVRAGIVPARRSLSQIFWWYVPLLVCCLLPALAGFDARLVIPHRWASELGPPGMAASTLLLAALFTLTVAADAAWGPRLFALFLLGLCLWGASPLAQDFAADTNRVARLAFIQTATPTLVLLVLQAVATYADPRGWGRWPLWAWITAATGLLIAYALLHMGVR